MKTTSNNRKGMTLVELLLTVAIFSLVIQLVYSIFFVGQKSFVTSKDIGFAQQEARLPIDYINRQVRTAKNVYFVDPSSIAQYPYYSIGINNLNQLEEIEYHSLDSNTPKIIASGIDAIEFNIIYDSVEPEKPITNQVNLSVVASESSIQKKYETLIRFENSGDIINYDVIPTEKITVVFYTKY